VIAGSARLVRLATRCLNGSTTTVKRAMGLLKERGLVESVQEIAGNKNHGRVLGRCFCGGGCFHSRRVMRPVKMRMTVLSCGRPMTLAAARGFCGEEGRTHGHKQRRRPGGDTERSSGSARGHSRRLRDSAFGEPLGGDSAGVGGAAQEAG
jgi:hypothetical protein